MRLLALLLLLGTPLAAQDRSIPQSGTEHTAAKTAYSLAVYGTLRELGVSKQVAAPVATVGLWSLGILIEHRKGHHQPLIDKAHDLAAHTLVTIPLSLRKKPKLALGSFLAAALSIAVTCAKANPRSC